MLSWDKINTVFLDMDGTLLDLNFDNHFWREFVPLRYAERNRLSLAEAKQALMPRFKAMEGKMEWYCLDYWSRELDLDISGLKAEMAGLISVLPHVIEFLEAVHKIDKRLVLVTNAHPKSLGLKMEKTYLRRFFDAIICAHDLGLPKEHPAFWERLQRQMAFDLEATLLVDDSLSVLQSARAFGIKHLFAVSKPDSKQSPRKIAGFSAIADFRELMPLPYCGVSGIE